MFSIPDSEVSVVIDGPGAAEIWGGSTLLGIVYEHGGAAVLRLESHARGPLTLSAEALEHALARARSGVRSAPGAIAYAEAGPSG